MARGNNIQSFRCKLEALLLRLLGRRDGKGRSDRYPQNNLCECQLVTSARPVARRGSLREGHRLGAALPRLRWPRRPGHIMWAVVLALTVTRCSSVLTTRSPKRGVLLLEVHPFRVTKVRPLMGCLGVTADARHHQIIIESESQARAG